MNKNVYVKTSEEAFLCQRLCKEINKLTLKKIKKLRGIMKQTTRQKKQLIRKLGNEKYRYLMF